MIVRLRLLLICEDEVKAQEGSYTGFLVRGLVYDLLNRVDKRLADRLHTEKGAPSPFSVKPPYTLSEGRLRIFTGRVPSQRSFYVEVSTIKEDLVDVFCKALLQLPDGKATLSNSVVHVLSLDIDRVRSSELREADVINKFAIKFITPTFFREHIPKAERKVEKVRVVPLPDPIRLFTGLYNLWNAYLRPKVPDDYLDWLRQRPILVAGFKDLRTHRFWEHPHKGVFAIGFTGTVYYSLAQDTYDGKMARWTHRLLRLAEYTNVGGNRTAGYGWIVYKAFMDKPRKFNHT